MRRQHTHALAILALGGIVSTAAHAQSTGNQGPPSFRQQFADIARNPERLDDSTRLAKLFAVSWEYGLHEYPEWASELGRKGREGEWNDNSLAAEDRRDAEIAWSLEAIRSIDRSKLGPSDRVNYDLFLKGIESSIEGNKYPGRYLAINQLGGVQQDIAQSLGSMPADDLADYEHMIERLETASKLVDNTIERLRIGLDRGVTPPRVTLAAVPEQIRVNLVDDPMSGPILRPFTKMPATIPEADARRLRERASAIYASSLRPAFQRLYDYFTGTYLPKTRESIGLSAMPEGEAWYAFRVRQSSTTDLTPRQIHELGLREVARIRGEMEKVMRDASFNGTLAEFMTFLRTDPQFFHTDTTSLLQGYRDIAKRADPGLIRLFGRLPRLPYGVIATPSFMERSAPTAYYYSGSLKGGRPGFFYANTYLLSSRPKWEMEALTLHEAVPGHHLQIALAQEMEEGPEFRKYDSYTAYVEGWGLYAESLGTEMGFYQDPYSKFGQLTYEMWRAIRLVVDTGIHQFGWSRDSAISYFRANAAKTEHDIAVEVDRYIVWPGQAVAYKLGELKIKELRRRATAELGARFDVRAFHDTVLGSGAVPLDVLETIVTQWIEGVKRGS
ncbi:MAG TPA: DUF885 domain-containing protein [Candidatus Kapabacteria bacterium]|nr:DUF885 domain-containing protein [Candidatus Kapabacteria bacterium]